MFEFTYTDIVNSQHLSELIDFDETGLSLEIGVTKLVSWWWQMCNHFLWCNLINGLSQNNSHNNNTNKRVKRGTTTSLHYSIPIPHRVRSLLSILNDLECPITQRWFISIPIAFLLQFLNFAVYSLSYSLLYAVHTQFVHISLYTPFITNPPASSSTQLHLFSYNKHFLHLIPN